VGIPYAHDQLGLRTGPPKVTILLVVLNVIAYLATSLDYGLLQISDEWLWWGAFIPSSLADPRQWYRLFTSMFLHANLLHIFFNMIFLYNFGRLVETALGGKRYLVLYLLSGLAAEAFHAAFIPIEGPLTIVTPAIGASGAISGVLGAYLLLFPGSKLSLCFFYLYIPICFTASAAAYLIFWFVTQILQGYAMANIGVAVFAHAGGFVAGMALLPLLLDRERHRLLRALTASQRAFKYIMLGSAGLGRLSEIILVAALTSLAVGSVYSMASARQMDVPVKVLEATVTYRIYCAPQTVCDEGSSRDMVVLQLDGQPRLAAQISSDPVRIVYNRLEALGLLYDRALVRSTKSFSISRTVRVSGVPVDVRLSMEASYDRLGVLDSAQGSMRATILSCRAGVCVASGEGDFDFTLSTLISAEKAEPVSSTIILLSAVSLLLTLAAIDVTLRKAHDLELLA